MCIRDRINLLVNLFIGLSIGANVLVAQFYGAQRFKDLEAVSYTHLVLFNKNKL